MRELIVSCLRNPKICRSEEDVDLRVWEEDDKVYGDQEAGNDKDDTDHYQETDALEIILRKRKMLSI